jgi:hypothetical protein
MKKLIKKLLFLTLLTMMSVNSVVAQSMINTVVPGSDGNLPTPPVIAQAEAGHFGGLTLKSVYLDKTDRIWLADLQIPVIEDGEAEVHSRSEDLAIPLCWVTLLPFPLPPVCWTYLLPLVWWLLELLSETLL